MNLVRVQSEFTTHVSRLIDKSNRLGVQLTFGDAYRSQPEQQRLYDEALSKTLDSMHSKRLAVDFNFFIDGELFYHHTLITLLGDYWEGLHPNNRWGGNWKSFVDTPHFERLP